MEEKSLEYSKIKLKYKKGLILAAERTSFFYFMLIFVSLIMRLEKEHSLEYRNVEIDMCLKFSGREKERDITAAHPLDH